MSLDPNIYKDLVSEININEIDIFKLNISKVNKELKNNKSIEIKREFKIEDYKVKDDILEVYPYFHIIGFLEGNPEEIAFDIEFTYCVEYEKENLNKFEDIYIKFFTRRNVPVNIWPYARELISSLTNRIGYQTLIIEPYTV